MKVSGSLVIEHICSGCGLGSTITYDLPRPHVAESDHLEDSGAAKLSRGHNPVAGDILVDSPTKPEKQTKEWTDPETKLTWSLHEIGPNNHPQATEYAKSVGLRLATKEELGLAEKHGFRKHLGIKKDWVWSSSVNPNYAYVAYFLNGYYGYIYYGSRYFDFSSGAAVCVAP